jgi:hypothetical protein
MQAAVRAIAVQTKSNTRREVSAAAATARPARMALVAVAPAVKTVAPAL